MAARHPQARLAGEMHASQRLRAERDGLRLGAVGGEENVRVGPHAILHDEDVAGLGRERGGGDGGGPA